MGLRRRRSDDRSREAEILAALAREDADFAGLHLRLAVTPTDAVAEATGEARAVAEGVSARVVVDLPLVTLPVGEAEAARWGTTMGDVFERAAANGRCDRPERVAVSLPDGTQVTTLRGPWATGACHALWPDVHVDVDPRLGALVAMPHAQLAVVAPVVDRSVVTAYEELTFYVARVFVHEEAGAVSPVVHWWRRDELVPLPAELLEDVLTPPPAFGDLLDAVAVHA